MLFHVTNAGNDDELLLMYARVVPQHRLCVSMFVVGQFALYRKFSHTNYSGVYRSARQQECLYVLLV